MKRPFLVHRSDPNSKLYWKREKSVFTLNAWPTQLLKRKNIIFFLRTYKKYTILDFCVIFQLKPSLTKDRQRSSLKHRTAHIDPLGYSINTTPPKDSINGRDGRNGTIYQIFTILWYRYNTQSLWQKFCPFLGLINWNKR